ncbi:MAG: SDR family NAD(P)-dependent oxidoreductase [Chloroflexota bacterium]
MIQGRWQHAIVVGASSGIGEAIARELVGSGCKVALIARRGDVLDRIVAEINQQHSNNRALAFVHDARNTSEAQPLLQQSASSLGGLDLVVYASGIMPAIGIDTYPTQIDVSIVETNFIGAVAWLNAAADRFSRVGEGTIIGISSVAGERGRRGQPIYQASKAAMNSYLESLRTRLGPRGIRVLTAKPGYVRTPLIGDAQLPLPAISAQEAAHQILSAAASGKRVVFVPGWWRIFALALRSIPAPLYERLPIP